MAETATPTTRKATEPVRPAVPGDIPKHPGISPGDPVDADVVNALTGTKGDAEAGDVGIVGKGGNLDGSAAEVPTEAEIKMPSSYVAALGFTYIHADGRPMTVDKGATIPKEAITPGDARRFVELGYIKS